MKIMKNGCRAKAHPVYAEVNVRIFSLKTMRKKLKFKSQNNMFHQWPLIYIVWNPNLRL